MNWGGFAQGFASTFDFKGLAKYAADRDLREARDQAKADAVSGLITQGQQEVAAARGVTGKPAETVTTGSSQPTDSIIPNPEKASGATVTPITSPTDSPDAASAKTANSGMVNVADNAAPVDGEKKITPQAQPTAEKSAAPSTSPAPASNGLPFVVNGKGYATEGEARAAAEKHVQSNPDAIYKNMAVRMKQAYIDRGDMEAADKWEKWSEEKENKATMKEWAGAYRAAQMGNFEKAADHVFELYKRYDDGITPLSKETVKDKDGNVTGFNVKLKVEKTGEERTQFIDRKTLTEMGLSALSPPQMFELQYKRQVEADKQAAAIAADNAKSNRDFKEKVVLQDRKHDQDLEKLTIDKQLDAANASNKVKREVGAKVEALRSAGYSDDFINGVLPGIIGVGEYKKQTSPEEARRLAFSDRVKSDPMFDRKSPEDQKKILDQDMALIYGGVKPSSVPSTAAPSAPAAGLPQPSAAPSSNKGKVPVFDTKTNSIIYR